MSDFQLDDIAAEGASQPDSPWIRFSVDVGPGAPGFALINSAQAEGIETDELRNRILQHLNELAKTRTKAVVGAQLRSSGIRVHLTELKAAGG
jgi:hypothetical protein